MLYEAIRLGCEIYHANGRSYDEAYIHYRLDRDPTKWNNPDDLNDAEVRVLVEFRK